MPSVPRVLPNSVLAFTYVPVCITKQIHCQERPPAMMAITWCVSSHALLRRIVLFSPLVIRQVQSNVCSLAICHIIGLQRLLHPTALHRRKSRRTKHCSWLLFGAWPWCLLRQVLGARKAGAGGGPCHHAKSIFVFQSGQNCCLECFFS